ncbi:MAG: hypothetical protein R3B06_05985 [Kofleriaceae bacterium]
MTAPRVVGALALAVACRTAEPAPPPGQPGPAGLATFLDEVARRSPAGAAAVVAGLRVDDPGWARLVTPPYRAAFAAYQAGYPAATAGLAAALTAGGPVTVRTQYADDPRLAPALRRARVALPVGRPGLIATVGGRDLPVVFVFDRGWRALAGIDELTQAAIAAADPACARAYAQVGAPGPCMDAAAPVALAAVAGDLAGEVIACRRLRALTQAGCGDDRGSVAPAPHP